MAGAIIGKKRRRREELRFIAGIFTELLVLNETRGTDAAGVAVVRNDGGFKLFKRPGPVTELVEDKLYHCVLALDNKVTAVLGHARNKTRGGEHRNVNNHPIRAGRVLGTHNGHIANADWLVKQLRLPRFGAGRGAVPSGRSGAHEGAVQAAAGAVPRLPVRAARRQGRISAAFVNLNRPDRFWLLKGDMPLSLAYVSRFRAMFYASEGWMLEAALDGNEWRGLEQDAMTLSVLDGEAPLDFTQEDVAIQPPSMGQTARGRVAP